MGTSSYVDRTGRNPRKELESLRRAVAELYGADPETWPEHGNAPLAIAAGVALDQANLKRLTEWVADLQSGMYVNCVYCGHRYGPGETTPVSMADALKAHVEQCPEHPMSALKRENEELRAALSSEQPSVAPPVSAPQQQPDEWFEVARMVDRLGALGYEVELRAAPASKAPAPSVPLSERQPWEREAELLNVVHNAAGWLQEIADTYRGSTDPTKDALGQRYLTRAQYCYAALRGSRTPGTTEEK